DKEMYKKKIHYNDTDCGGVVYYANYLRYCEEARGEFFEDKGVSLKGLSEQGIWFVVQNVNITFKAPAKYGDLIQVETEITKMKNVSIDFHHEIICEDKVLNISDAKCVCVDSSFKPCVMPDNVKNAFNKG
ncbi:MAG: thioesterase family protein, partial [Candidatus Omnitrophota bacterium]